MSFNEILLRSALAELNHAMVHGMVNNPSVEAAAEYLRAALDQFTTKRITIPESAMFEEPQPVNIRSTDDRQTAGSEF